MRRLNKKNIASVLIVLFISVAFIGCLRGRSPDEFGYALLIGVDKGEQKPYLVSMLLQRGGKSDDKDASTLISVECADFFEGVGLLESGLPFALNLSRVTAMAFSVEVAQSGSMDELLSMSLGTLHIRNYANLIVVDGQASEFLHGLQNELNPNIAKLQYSFVKYGEATGYIPSITLAQFYDGAWSTVGDVVLPLGAYVPQPKEDEESQAQGDAQPEQQQNAVPPSPDLLGAQTDLPQSTGRTGGLESSLIGSALFRGTQMVGHLNGAHTQVLLMAAGKFTSGRLRVPLHADNIVSVLFFKKGKPNVTLVLSEEPYAKIKLSVGATIEEPAAVAGMEQAQIAAQISEYLERNMQDVFTACRGVGVDALGLGKTAAKQFNDTARYEEFDWDETLSRVRAEFQVDVFLTYNPASSRME